MIKCGYKYVKDDGTRVHIACNANKQWYQREFTSQDRGVWRRICPPTIIDGHLKQDGESVKVAVLQNRPIDLPTH